MIIVDSRDGSNELIPLLPDCIPCVGLDTDICIPGYGPGDIDVNIGVEVKKMDDLLKSISSGRLADTQLEPLLDNYFQSWILTIGSYREGRMGELQIQGRRGWYPYRIGNRSVPVGYLESSLIELQAVGLHHKHVADNSGAARWLLRLERWWSKPWSKHRGLAKFDRSSSVRMALMPDRDPIEEQMARAIKELPGLGWDRAWAAAKHFDSLEAAFNANIHQWAAIPGIGKVLAKTAVETIARRKRNG